MCYNPVMRNCSASVPGNDGNTKQKHFKVYKTGAGLDIQSTYTRRDFAKIYLITGETHIHASGKTIHTDKPILLFEPLAAYSLNVVSGTELSFACLFSRNLLEYDLCSNTYRQLMTFAGVSMPMFFHLDSKQKNFIAGVFEQIFLEQDRSYTFNHELFCNYMNLILHEVLKKSIGNIPSYQQFHLN
jgi:AraC family transcriptional activator of pobA